MLVKGEHNRTEQPPFLFLFFIRIISLSGILRIHLHFSYTIASIAPYWSSFLVAKQMVAGQAIYSSIEHKDLHGSISCILVSESSIISYSQFVYVKFVDANIFFTVALLSYCFSSVPKQLCFKTTCIFLSLL